MCYHISLSSYILKTTIAVVVFFVYLIDKVNNLFSLYNTIKPTI